MLLVRQCKDTFIRTYNDEIGYIANQLTKKDRIYDEIGAFFLKQISRAPKRLNDIASIVTHSFPETPDDEIYRDVIEFITTLESDGYIVTGNSEKDLDQKEPQFSYKNSLAETAPSILGNEHITESDSDVWGFFSEYFRKHPQIFELQIEVTSDCNLRCCHCYLPHSREKTDIDTHLLIDVFDQLAEMGTVGVNLSGGECLLHEDFEKFLHKARANDFAITVLSNAVLLNEEHIQALKEVGINQFQASLYSMNAEEHDAITQLPDSHAKTLSNLEKMICANIPVQVSCPVMKINLHSYKDVLKWAYSHNIKAYTDYVMMARTDFTTSNLQYRIDLDEAEVLLRDILVYDKEYRSMLEDEQRFMDRETLSKKSVCGVGIDSMCLAANGNCYPCSGFQGYILGNVHSQRLKEIWQNSDAVQKLRKITYADLPECLQCEAIHFCSKCLVRNFNESNGDMFKVNKHFCDIAFLNKKLITEYRQKYAANSAKV